METFYYYKALRTTIIQFCDIFNGLKIAKYDSNGNITKYITVPVKFSTKDKMYQYIRDNKRTRPLPMMAVQLYGINHDQTRIANKASYIPVTKSFPNSNVTSYLAPVPYNLEFQITILGNYMTEVDQILEQILGYFNPFIFMRIKLSDITDDPFEIKILYTSSTPETPTDMAETDYRVVGWTLYFTVYTYFFTPVLTEGLTKKIITKYYTSDNAWEHQGTETGFTSGASGSYESESYLLKAIGYDGDEVDYEEHYFSIEEYE
jgi:hypothetical protein